MSSKNKIYHLIMPLLFVFSIVSCDTQSEKNLIKNSSNETSFQIDSFNIFYDKGYELLNIGKYTDAINYFSKAIYLKPEDANSYYCRGFSYSALGYDSLAIRDFDDCIKINSNHKGAYFGKALSLSILNKTQEAVINYDYVLVLDSLFSNALYNRGLLKLKLNQNKQGVDDIKKAAQLNDIQAIEYVKKHLKN